MAVLKDVLKSMENFIQKVLSGKSKIEDIDDFIDEWHNSKTEILLHEYLGFTKKEYSLWLRNPDIIFKIIDKNKEKENGKI